MEGGENREVKLEEGVAEKWHNFRLLKYLFFIVTCKEKTSFDGFREIIGRVYLVSQWTVALQLVNYFRGEACMCETACKRAI